MGERRQQTATTTGLIAAIAASSCCIAPVVAVFAGVGTFSAGLTWLEPLRPFLIGFSVLAIGLAWVLHLKPKPKDDCGCEIKTKPRFFEGRPFLIAITLFAALAIGFPSYAHLLSPSGEVQNTTEQNLKTVNLTVTGMTCTGCEVHVNAASSEVEGVKESKSDFKTESAVVVYDTTITQWQQIAKHIEKETGYSVGLGEK